MMTSKRLQMVRPRPGQWVLLWVLGVLGLVACDPAEPPKNLPDKIYVFDQQFLNNLRFEPGSYWRYEDTVTNDFDTLFLIRRGRTFDTLSTPGVAIQHFNAVYYSWRLMDTLYMFGRTRNEGPQNGDVVAWIGTNPNRWPIYYQPFDSGKEVTTSNVRLQMVNDSDGVIIAGQPWSDVKFYEALDQVAPFQMMKMTWVETLGLAGFTDQAGTEWLLTDFFLL